MTSTAEFFRVGGCNRDEILGIRTKDVDFVVVGHASFDEMVADLESQGFTPFQLRPEFVTARCGVPKDHLLRAETSAADFVMARKDSATGDGRRPDFVEPGTLFDDLARRDFTVNAIAKTVAGDFVDPHGGLADLARMQLRFVGDPLTRIHEDGLRVLRGFRFMVTKGFTAEPNTRAALTSPFAVEMLKRVSVDRIRDELDKMLRCDTRATLDILSHEMPPVMLNVIFRDGLRLAATSKA